MRRGCRDRKRLHPQGILLTTLLVVQHSLLAQTNTTVVPFGYENQAGNAGSTVFQGSETQDLFRGSYIAAKWTTPVSITGISLRVRPNAGSFNAVIPSIDIRFSTTSATPETMSLVYTINKGSDEMTVYSHTSVPLFAAANQPLSAFDLHFKFDQPFAYDPTKGNLLLDFIIGGPNQLGTTDTDLIELSPPLSGSPVARVHTGPGGFVFPDADIIRFDTVSVPEPSISLLGLFGMVCVVGFALKVRT